MTPDDTPAFTQVEITHAGTFQSGLGCAAHIIYATPLHPSPAAAAREPLYFHGGYGVEHWRYIGYLAQYHGLRAFTVIYEGKRAKDTTYWVVDPQDGCRTLMRARDVRQLASTLSGSIIGVSQTTMADDIMTAMDLLGFRRTDIIGQSVGTPRVIELAHKAPERVGNIILAYPAGVFKPERHRVMAAAINYGLAMWRLRHETLPDDNIRYLQPPPAAQEIISRHSQPQSITADGESVFLSWYGGLLSDVRRRSDAPGLAIVTGLEDHLFSPERILETLPGPEAIDYMRIEPGLHGFRGQRHIVDNTVALFPLLERRKARRATASHFQPLRDRLFITHEATPQRAARLRALAAEADEQG